MPRYKVIVGYRERRIYVVTAENQERAEQNAITYLEKGVPNAEEYADELFDYNHGYDDDIRVESIKELNDEA